jgi:ribose 5-phosphate isomerase
MAVVVVGRSIIDFPVEAVWLRRLKKQMKKVVGIVRKNFFVREISSKIYFVFTVQKDKKLT